MATAGPEEVAEPDNDPTKEGIEALDEVAKAKMLDELGELEKTLDSDTPIESIPEMLWECPLSQISESTFELLCQHLDLKQDILSESKKVKNFIGLSEWAGLDHGFTKHVASSHYTWKTKEVITKWIATQRQLERKATVGNLASCLDGEDGIDRPDVLTDTAPCLAKDACKWLRAVLGGISAKPPGDTSWQLTIHDAVSGVRTQYTSCLVYADEDHGMAEIITQVFTNVLPNVKFFRPQFHLKIGVYECETTAEVIEERCKGRVIFIISDYFFAAPELCRFALNFSRTLDIAAQRGKVIPFQLTSSGSHVPRLLQGITGVRWFRKAARKTSWLMLTDSILGGDMPEDELTRIKIAITNLVESDAEYYLGDPPYSDDTPPPGPPMMLYDPPPETDWRNSTNSSSGAQAQSDDEQLVKLTSDKSKKSVRKRIWNFLKKNHRTKAIEMDGPSLRTLNNENMPLEFD